MTLLLYKKKAVEDMARYGPLSSLIYVAPLPILFSAYPKALEFISGGSTKEISKTLKTLVPIMSTGVILDAIRFNPLQQFRALNDFFVTSIIAFFGLSSGIFLAAMLGFKTPMGIDGVGVGYMLGIMITTVALGLRWRTKIAEVVVVSVENNTPLEPLRSEKPSLWNSVFCFFHFGGNSSSVQTEADFMEARSLFEPC